MDFNKNRTMKTIKINPKETGWVSIPCDIKTIVAHFNDGHKETMPLLALVTIARLITINLSR